MRPRIIFGVLLPAFLLTHFALRLLEGDNLRWDECEQTLFSQRFELGYNDQPPVYTWLLRGVFRVTGVSLVGVYILKYAVIAAIYLGLYAVARRLMPTNFAVPAALSLLLTPYLAWEALRDGAHTPYVAAFVPPLVLVTLRLVERPTTWMFTLLGVVIGFGFLAKYSFLLLAVALPAAMLTMPEYRRRLLDPRLLLTALVAGLIVLPHARWVLDHWDAIRARPMERGGFGTDSSFPERVAGGVWSLVQTVGLVAGPLCAAFLVFFPHACVRSFTQRADRPDVRLVGRFIAVVAAMLLLLILAGVSLFRTHWLIPILVVVPAYVLARASERPMASWRPRGYVALIAVAVIVVVVVRVGRVVKENRPGGKEFARDAMYAELASRAPQATFIGDNPIACGNLRVHHPDWTIHCVYYPAFLPSPPYAEPVYAIWDATEVDTPVPNSVKALAALGYKLDESEVFFVSVPGESRDRNLRRIGVMRLRR